MLQRLEKVIFFLLVFFISAQTGIHFWPEFSYVTGVRIDYLSPTLYLLDIFIFLIFVIFIVRNKFNIKRLLHLPFKAVRNDRKVGNRNDKLFKIVFLLFLVSLLWNSFYALSPEAHFFGIVKMSEFIFLAIYIAATFDKSYMKPFIIALAASAMVSGVLAMWQFINQSSVGGLWYYFGERTFNSTTIGISTVNLHEQILRPYAAFPHPNILAFFLFMTIVFISFNMTYAKKTFEKVFLILALCFCIIALFTTFSRVAIILIIIFSFYEIYSKRNSNLAKASLVLLVTSLVIITFMVWPYIDQFVLRGINFRSELYDQAIFMLGQYPLFGIGLNNFFIHQVPLVKNISPILFQPPHNIYLLSILSIGFVGWWIFPYVLFQAFKKLNQESRIKNYELRSFKQSILICLLGILIAGFFDHYFLTLEQGQIIFALIIGLSFASFKPETFKKRKG